MAASEKLEASFKEPLSIIILGASGDLARKKIIPAVFSLYCQKLLPEDVRIFGFSRSQYDDEKFREVISANLTCRYIAKEDCAEAMKAFLARCYYVAGDYSSADAYLDLYQRMAPMESGRLVNRLFYMAIPPFLFLDVAGALGDSGFVKCGPSKTGWSRAVIEKPFGRDSESSKLLVSEMAMIFNETQTFRIDHYLGKEVIQNLIVLRFANLVFEPIWNREYIRSVHISFKEDFGVADRAGYFDEYGIVRDVMQNHLLQMLALIAMERPASLSSRDVRNEKVRVLRAIRPILLDDIVLGQYEHTEIDGKSLLGYHEEHDIPQDSLTPTFAATVLKVNNPRWEGVPFYLSAGKSLDSRMTEIRVEFRDLPSNIFTSAAPSLGNNELVIRVQPDEAIYLTINNKVPGLRMQLEQAPLDLLYASTFRKTIPEAYESLLLDVIRGDKSLFIREDELAAAWEIFTPVLHEIERREVRPDPYPCRSKGPKSADALAERFGVERK